MPIYEYRCGKCGEFEVMQRITDKTLTKCPTCKAKVNKLISNTSFQLKGSGWYVTDYARAGNGGGKGKDAAKSNDSSPSESKSESTSESKSDSTSESKSEVKAESKSKGSSPAGKTKQADAA